MSAAPVTQAGPDVKPSAIRGNTLAEAFDSHRNSLNIMRLGLAGLVIFSHCWPLGGFAGIPSVHGVDGGRFAVLCFFAISGYLVTGSRLNADYRRYAQRRALRILPGLWGTLTVTAFVISPLVAALTDAPWSFWSAVRYVMLNSSSVIMQPGIEHTLTDVPHSHTQWNGALWTLQWEIACYVVIGLLIGLVSKRWLGPAVVALLGFTTAGWLAIPALLDPWSPIGLFTPLAVLFLAGAALRIFADWVPCSTLLAAGAVIAVPGLLKVDLLPVAALPIAYLLLWAAIRLPLHGLARRHDYSYGVYIYGFPIQQSLSAIGANGLGLPRYMALSFLLTAPLAVVSWHLIERPAMRRRTRSTTGEAPPPHGERGASARSDLTRSSQGVSPAHQEREGAAAGDGACLGALGWPAWVTSRSCPVPPGGSGR